MSFENRLRELREQSGKSQKAIAELSGVGLSSLKYYERGKVIPSIYAVKALAEHYGVSIDYLVYGHDADRTCKQDMIYL